MDVQIDDNGLIIAKLLANDSGKISSQGKTKQFAYGQVKVQYKGRTIVVQLQAYEKL